jgi:hypothetical protein
MQTLEYQVMIDDPYSTTIHAVIELVRRADLHDFQKRAILQFVIDTQYPGQEAPK